MDGFLNKTGESGKFRQMGSQESAREYIREALGVKNSLRGRGLGRDAEEGRNRNRRRLCQVE
jgi:hypothetical protein